MHYEVFKDLYVQLGNFDSALSGAMCVSCPADETFYFLLFTGCGWV
jgi:hypothetical protein